VWESGGAPARKMLRLLCYRTFIEDDVSPMSGHADEKLVVYGPMDSYQAAAYPAQQRAR